MSGAVSAFRDRKVLFVVVLVVLAANVAVLVSYRTFYDERLRGLVSERSALEKRRDEARRKAEEAVASEKRLFETQEALTAFFSETLGKREERIAPLIEEIYRTTKEAHLRPDQIGYTSVDEPGTDSLTMSFNVTGPYADVKRLLSELERSKRFLVVDRLSIHGGSADEPDSVTVAFVVTNYFRPAALRPIRAVRSAAARVTPAAAKERTAAEEAAR